MKKSILNLGNALNKAEQKTVFGGTPLRKHDGNCDNVVNEGTCSGYQISGYEEFDVFQVGGGVSGSGYYEYPCNC